ncbi:MAG: hypothetical protein Q8M09_00870 [Pseudomonadota bacterium]|nr:hypothetical protein [Pseudomonadota bacterium]MDP1902798.1 hypothetical protein [Pseudomonadota bacterium]MDP2354066.1 hypothetical protein [Pseudomonadota bacterium]
MKFQLLPLGARFEYEGKVYVKAGPLTAAGDSGQRMIPRHAVLKPLDVAPVEAPKRASRKLDESAVKAALEAFHGECARLLQAIAEQPDQAQAARAVLDAARQRFLDALV